MGKGANVYIISRRAWHIEDLECGTFEPILVSLDRAFATTTFNSVRSNVLRDKETTKFDGNVSEFGYHRKNWCYEYRIRVYELNKFDALAYKQS